MKRVRPMNIINDGLEPAYFKELVDNILDIPFYRAIGIEPIRLGKGYSEFSFVNTESGIVGNSNDVVHGGALMTCADTSMGLAVLAAGYKTATVRMGASFLRPCPLNSKIICKGEIVKYGSNVFFCKSQIWSDDRLVADFDGIFINQGKEDGKRAHNFNQ